MSVDVSPTNKNSSHHISLESSAGTKIGLILSSPNAIQRNPRVGSTYTPFTQKDWSGGRGLKFATDDRSRYADGKRLNSRRAGTLAIGARETFITGHRQQEQFMPAAALGVTWQPLTGSSRFIASQVTISDTGNRARINIWVRRRGTPGTLQAQLRTSSAGEPATVEKTVTATTTDIDDFISVLFEFTFTSVQAVTAAALHWVEISGAGTDDDDNHWEVGTDATRSGATTKASADGTTSSWAVTTYDLYYRLVDDTDISGAFPFEYKKQLYFLTRPTGGAAPKLYMNGYRGVATGATQSRTALQDTTQNWDTDELAGRIIYIVDGPNSEQRQPYRRIASNTANTIQWATPMSSANVAAQTCYVILGTDTLTEITGHGLTYIPSDIATTGDILYFAQGDSVKMRRMQERNLAGVWTRAFAEENNYAKLILAYRDPSAGMMLIKANDYDNSNRPSVATARAEPWGPRLKFPLLIDACESTSGWTFDAAVTGVQDTSVYQAGSAAIKMTVAAGAGDVIGYRAITGTTLRSNKKIRLWVLCSENLAAGVLKFRLSASATCATAITNGDLSLPALNSNEWTLVELPYKEAGLETVVTIGILKTTHSGIVRIDGIEALPAGSEIPLGSEYERINGLVLYGDPKVPWVLRTGSIGWIANGTYNPVPLEEFSQVENIHNGMGHLVHDVYLYVSFGQGLEEYYRANLDDVGPNRDEGMPEARQGFITSMVGYPDRLIANYDAGTDGYSSINSRKGSGWHEEYRCDTPGKRIRFVYLQKIEGPSADRLWFIEGEDIGYLPMPGNTVNELTDASFRFTHEAVIESGWIGDDQQRLFSSLKIGIENATAARCVEWDYKLDEAASWTSQATPFTSGPVQELALNKTGKRLKIRLRLQTNDPTETPEIYSINISTTEQPTPRHSYTMQFVYYDNAVDLQGNKETYERAETLIAQLDAWAAEKTPLTMRSMSETYDNKTVFLEPLPLGTIAIAQQTQQEKGQGTLTATEPL